MTLPRNRPKHAETNAKMFRHLAANPMTETSETTSYRKRRFCFAPRARGRLLSAPGPRLGFATLALRYAGRCIEVSGTARDLDRLTVSPNKSATNRRRAIATRVTNGYLLHSREQKPFSAARNCGNASFELCRLPRSIARRVNVTPTRWRRPHDPQSRGTRARNAANRRHLRISVRALELGKHMGSAEPLCARVHREAEDGAAIALPSPLARFPRSAPSPWLAKAQTHSAPRPDSPRGFTRPEEETSQQRFNIDARASLAPARFGGPAGTGSIAKSAINRGQGKIGAREISASLSVALLTSFSFWEIVADPAIFFLLRDQRRLTRAASASFVRSIFIGFLASARCPRRYVARENDAAHARAR
jgi:hypothetical protein